MKILFTIKYRQPSSTPDMAYQGLLYLRTELHGDPVALTNSVSNIKKPFRRTIPHVVVSEAASRNSETW